MSKHIELVAKLREIFQIDRPDLDFGIYRILNTRAAEINAYLEQRLPEKVKAALAQGSAAQQEQVARELQEKEAQYHADGIEPGTVPKVRELREKLAQYQAGASEHENAVFSHLLAFFARYYKDGDFISQRRYKGDTYAIPYAGEEVMLHWANKDQYYTKSGENFANYSFKLDDGRTVHFRLAAADTAKDNRKDNDKERRFALIARKTVTRVDDQGDEVEEELLPVEEVDGVSGKELLVRFEYAPQPKGTRQDALVQKAVAAVLAEEAVRARWLALGRRAPTEKDPQRTLLEKHLSDYTTRNTADYFIHKDLGGFLRRELDFYIKNEAVHLDDIQTAGAFADIEKSLRMIQCFRAIALELIAFLAQLEGFQKRLWLKRKFVASSHYSITLDRLPETLYEDVISNPKQWARWVQLGMLNASAKPSREVLKNNPHLPVETELYPPKFRHAALSGIEDLDTQIDGLLIKGDNFQALRLLDLTYQDRIKCAYIDPPYNTGGDDFLYKDGFQSSSWLTLMENRLSAAKSLIASNGVIAISLDQCEIDNLGRVVQESLGRPLIQRVIWKKTDSPNEKDNAISTYHEYVSIYGANGSKTNLNQLNKPEILEAYPEKEIDGRRYRLRQARKNGASARREDRPSLFFPVSAPDGTQVLPMAPEGWEGRWVMAESTFNELSAKDLIVWKERSYGWVPYYKEYAPDEPMTPYSSIWDDLDQNRQAKAEYTALLGGIPFANPKPSSLIARVAKIACNDGDFLLDFFAGSGTSGSAVVRLWREDGLRRRFILIEQGAHFDNILLPRVLKTAYSEDWTDGAAGSTSKPKSHWIKIIRIEGYEDTLNNLQMPRSSARDDLFSKLPKEAGEDFLVHYILDVESRDSLLSVRDFKKPFDYTLNISVDSAGAFERCEVDLVETFNYLIGLRVKQIDAQIERGFVTVTGALPSGETCLVLWRDCEKLDYEGITKLCDKLAINPADNEYDVVYINGDHNIPTVLTQTAEEGGATRVLKLRQIEPEFLERMFSTEDV